MPFSPNEFLSNINAKEGLARPARFEVVLPIPGYIAEFVQNSLIERILNLPNSIMSDITDAINSAIGADSDRGMKSANPAMSRYLALQCETAEIPGKTLQTDDVKIYGPTFKVPYQTQYGDTSFTFICTNDFYERKLFERWLEAIMPTDTNNLRYPMGQNSQYMTEITIKQYNDDVKQIYGVKLIEAFPIGVAAQPLSWAEEGFHRLTVQFAYRRYEVIPDGKYDIGQIVTSGVNAGARALLRV
jgi:hypothetical protein